MKRYDSAYPGSMVENNYGQYVNVDDIDSLIEAIQRHVRIVTNELESAEYMIEQLRTPEREK